jgi:hypothetical protein
MAAQSVLDLTDVELTEVEDAGCKHRIGACLNGWSEVSDSARAAAGNKGHADLSSDGSDQI